MTQALTWNQFPIQLIANKGSLPLGYVFGHIRYVYKIRHLKQVKKHSPLHMTLIAQGRRKQNVEHYGEIQEILKTDVEKVPVAKGENKGQKISGQSGSTAFTEHLSSQENREHVKGH